VQAAFIPGDPGTQCQQMGNGEGRVGDTIRGEVQVPLKLKCQPQA
jgi:hypothetical protein